MQAWEVVSVEDTLDRLLIANQDIAVMAAEIQTLTAQVEYLKRISQLGYVQNLEKLLQHKDDAIIKATVAINLNEEENNNLRNEIQTLKHKLALAQMGQL